MATQKNTPRGPRKVAQRAAPAITKPEATEGKGLSVTPKVPGFRRAGYAFPDGETVIPLDDLSDVQFEQLTTEQMLVTHVTDIEAAADAAAAAT